METLFKITLITLAIIFFPITLGFFIWGRYDAYKWKKSGYLGKDNPEDYVLL